MFAVYIHVPFCKQKCKYCDFNSHPGLDALHQAYVVALKKEIALEAPRFEDRTVTSIFFGGGTPTLLEPSQLAGILKAVESSFNIARICEITVEANPETVTVAKLSA